MAAAPTTNPFLKSPEVRIDVGDEKKPPAEKKSQPIPHSLAWKKLVQLQKLKKLTPGQTVTILKEDDKHEIMFVALEEISSENTVERIRGTLRVNEVFAKVFFYINEIKSVSWKLKNVLFNIDF